MLIFERGKSSATERKKTIIASVLAGSVLFTASTLQQVGISVSKSVGISGFLTGLYTIFVPIACYVFFKKKTGINVVFSAVLAVIGIFMLCKHLRENRTFSASGRTRENINITFFNLQRTS